VVVVVVVAPLQLALPSAVAGCVWVSDAEHELAPVPLQDAAPPDVVDDVEVSVVEPVPLLPLLPLPQAERPRRAVAAIARDALVFMLVRALVLGRTVRRCASYSFLGGR